MTPDSAVTTDSDQPVMYIRSMGVYLNLWFANYENARAARETHGGFLFPYGSHFFVADGDAVRLLGLDPAAPDWQLIGWDWVRPLDVQAWQRLRAQREIAA